MSLDVSTDSADLIIFDDILPTSFSPFRTVEYSHYLSFFDAKLVSTEGWHGFTSDQSFTEALDALPLAPDLKRRILPFSEAAKARGRLAYVSFLTNALRLMPYFEACQLPFIFQLYPGGGFQINQPECDEKLRRVVLSDYCRKVIVTQKISHEYLLDTVGCNPEKVELIFGGVFESRHDFDFHRDKKFYGKDKQTIDICFVAHKYGDDLHSKGYDQFVAIARLLSRQDSRLQFHVVGGYSANDIPLGAAADKFFFFGVQENQFFRDFYPSMDAIISINRPFSLAPGAFDGFPTGACIEAGLQGVLNCINDPLALNPCLKPGKEFLFLDFDQERSVAELRQWLDCPQDLYRLAYANWRKYRQVFATDDQLWARTRLITTELLCVGAGAVATSDTQDEGTADSNRRRAGQEDLVRWVELERERERLMEAYRKLECHYLAMEAERNRLERYIQAGESLRGNVSPRERGAKPLAKRNKKAD